MGVFGKIRDWFRNYWYYYKWFVIIGAFFVGVIVFCLVQSQSRAASDALILYTGPHFFESGEKSALQNAFSQIMSEDCDGDGRRTVEIVDMPAFSDEEIRERIGDSPEIGDVMQYAAYTYSEVQKNFSKQVFAGETVICLLDPYWFSLLESNGGLVPLREILGFEPGHAVDEYGVRFSELDFARFFEAAGKLPEDTVICFRRLSTASGFTGKKEAEKNYESSKTVLRDIFAFVAPSS